MDSKIIEKAIKDIEMAAVHCEQAAQLYYNAVKALRGVSTPSSKKTKSALSDEQIASLKASIHKGISVKK